MTSRQRSALLGSAAVLVLLLALGLRLHRVGAQSLWYDEGTSAGLATRDAVTIVRNASNDIHPPLYYLALAGWARFAGHGEAALRGLSVFAGVVLVALVLGMGRRLWGWGEGIAAGLLAATSPFLVWYSQEARMYSLAAALGTALAWVAAELARAPASPASPTSPASSASPASPASPTSPASPASSDGRTARRPLRRAGLWVAYVALAVGALYTHYFVGASALIAANLIAVAGILRARNQSRSVPWGFVGRWAAAQVLALALFIPWVAAAWHTISDWPALGPPLGTRGLAWEAINTFAVGIHRVPDLGGWVVVTAALALVGILGGLQARRRWGTVVAGSMVAAPLVGMWLLSLTRPAWDPKFLIAAAPGFELLMGAGVVVAGRWTAAMVVRIASRDAGRTGPAGSRTGLEDGSHGPENGPGQASWARAVSAMIWAALLLLVLWPRAQALQAMYYEPSVQRDDYRGIADSIEAHAGPEDAVIVNAPTQIEVFDYYDRGRHAAYPIPLGRQPDRETVRRRLADIATAQRDLYAVLWATDESDPEGAVEGWLDERRAKAFDRWFGDVRLAMWAARREPMRIVLMDMLSFGDDEIDLVRLAVGPAAPMSPDPRAGGGDQSAQETDEATTTAPDAAGAPLPEAPPAISSVVALADSGAHVNTVPGGVVTVDAWWAPVGPNGPQADYSVFLHLTDGAGRVVAQRDMAPQGGSARTSEWPAVSGLSVETDVGSRSVSVATDGGDVMLDKMALLVPTDVAPGEYGLLLGLYDPATGERLPVRPSLLVPGEEQANADSVEIAVVTIRDGSGGAR